MTTRIFLKLLLGVFCLLAVSMLVVDYFASRVAESNYIGNLTHELAQRGSVIALTLGDPAKADPQQVRTLGRAAGARLTFVTQAGFVLLDTDADAAHMENHRSRPEIVSALQGKLGSSVRHSATIGVDFLYVALPMRGGALRLAVPLSEIRRQVNGLRNQILVSTALAFLPAIGIAALVARYVSRRFARVMKQAGELANGNFRARLAESESGEFGELGRQLNETAAKLERTVEQLESEHSQLESLERIRKDFVINVSHELRTPLASIQGYTETLMDGAIHDADNNMRFLDIIRHNAERLARLTEDLLTLSRVELRRQDFHPGFYPIEDLIADALEMLRPIAEKKEIRLTQDNSAMGSEAWCDAEAVSQVLSNLLDNAIKYTPVGGTIGAGARLSGREIEVHVRDSGVGIPAEDLPRLFERFYRVDKARSRALGGTGLGLSIVKHLVAAQGGKVWVESSINQGSTFFFTLPAEDPGRTPGQQLNAEFTAL